MDEGRLNLRVVQLLEVADMRNVGARIRDVRRAAGLTQRDVGGEAFQAAYLSRIETGDRRPSPRVLERIARVCDVDPLALVIGDSGGDDQAARAHLVARAAARWLESPTDVERYRELTDSVRSWQLGEN